MKDDVKFEMPKKPPNFFFFYGVVNWDGALESDSKLEGDHIIDF